eukprot:1569245-Pyramimonas_sp.AAC.1
MSSRRPPVGEPFRGSRRASGAAELAPKRNSISYKSEYLQRSNSATYRQTKAAWVDGDVDYDSALPPVHPRRLSSPSMDSEYRNTLPVCPCSNQRCVVNSVSCCSQPIQVLSTMLLCVYRRSGSAE